MGDTVFWDEKFGARSENPLKPEGSIVERVKLLKGSSVLDIACGDGRNSLFLLENGFDVTGIDFSQKGLERLQKFSVKYTGKLSTHQVDLSQLECFTELDQYDNVVICHYRLMQDQLKSLADHVNQHGIVMITGFGHNHQCDERISENELIYKEDVEVLLTQFKLVEYSENTDVRGFFVTYVLEKM